MVSLPLPLGDRTTEYLDRIWGNFYVGFVLTTAKNRSKVTLLQSQLRRISLSHSLDDRTLRERTVRQYQSGGIHL